MNKFESYCASFITPQMTLLEKQNAIIEYLKQNPTLNIYMCSANYSTSQILLSLLANPANHTISVGDLVCFADCKVSVIITIGSTYFTVGSSYINYKGDKGDRGEKGEKGDVISNYMIIPNTVIPEDDFNKLCSGNLTPVYITMVGTTQTVSYYFHVNYRVYNHDVMTNPEDFEFISFDCTSDKLYIRKFTINSTTRLVSSITEKYVSVS